MNEVIAFTLLIIAPLIIIPSLVLWGYKLFPHNCDKCNAPKAKFSHWEGYISIGWRVYLCPKHKEMYDFYTFQREEEYKLMKDQQLKKEYKQYLKDKGVRA